MWMDLQSIEGLKNKKFAGEEGILLYLFWLHHVTCRILVPQPWIPQGSNPASCSESMES